MTDNDLYSSKAKRFDTIIGESKIIWMQIVSAKREYDLLNPVPTLDFYNWMEETYGIKLKLSPAGEMRLENDITDDEKYLLFILKHTKND